MTTLFDTHAHYTDERLREKPDLLQEALAACTADEEIFLIGGASVYAEGLPLADRLCLTHIHHTPAEADAFFPPFEARDWTVSFSESHPADEKNEQPYTFTDYVRKK